MMQDPEQELDMTTSSDPEDSSPDKPGLDLNQDILTITITTASSHTESENGLISPTSTQVRLTYINIHVCTYSVGSLRVQLKYIYVPPLNNTCLEQQIHAQTT